MVPNFVKYRITKKGGNDFGWDIWVGGGGIFCSWYITKKGRKKNRVKRERREKIWDYRKQRNEIYIFFFFFFMEIMKWTSKLIPNKESTCIISCTWIPNKTPYDLIVVKLVLFLRFDYNGFRVTFVVYICIKTPFPLHCVHVWFISPQKKKKIWLFFFIKKKDWVNSEAFFWAYVLGHH